MSDRELLELAAKAAWDATPEGSAAKAADWEPASMRSAWAKAARVERYAQEAMSEHPEALRLADALEVRGFLGTTANKAATELRRQHAEIERLYENYERLRLEKEQWETAVRNCLAMSNGREDEWGSRAEWAFGFLHAAIAKAEEVNP